MYNEKNRTHLRCKGYMEVEFKDLQDFVLYVAKVDPFGRSIRCHEDVC